MQRKWLLYEAEDDQNKIDLMYEAPTTEKAGVKIIVPVKFRDREEFYTKIKEQLAYFENVYFDCGDRIKNDHTIVRNENFQWSSLISNPYMHICLDNVYYPIDFSKLGINGIIFPIALRFSLTDGIFPVPNREQLKYTTEAKAAIMKKLEQVADFFVGKYNETIKETDDIRPVVEYFRNDARLVSGYDGDKWNVEQLITHASLKYELPKLQGVKLLDLQKIHYMKDNLVWEYNRVYEFVNKRFKKLEGKYYSTANYSNTVDRGTKVYLFTEQISKQKKDYIRDTCQGPIYFVRKEKEIKLGRITAKNKATDVDYMSLLDLIVKPRTEWRARIKEWQHIQSLITKDWIDTDAIVVPQTWVDGKKKTRAQKQAITGTARRKKLEGEVTGKEARTLERYVSGKNCKFEPLVIQMKDAHKDKKLTIYGGMDLTEIFDSWFTVLKKDRVRLIMFSERELKRLEGIELHNWISMEEFVKGEHKVFRRVATAYLIRQLINQYPKVFDKQLTLGKISTPLFDKVNELKTYENQYHLAGSEELYKTIIQVAEETKLFDPIMYANYKEVKFLLAKLPFLNQMLSFGYSWEVNESLVSIIRDLFKYYKYKIDWQHYTLPINEEEKIEEEETV